MSNPSPHPPIGHRRDGALDGLRGLSALAILAWHYIPSIGFPDIGTALAYLKRSLSLCWIGVDVFFVLSGFLIGAILLRERRSPRYYQTFYARRSLRILPLYLALLGFFIAIPALGFLERWPVLQESWNTRGVPLWSHFLFIQNLFMPGADDFGSKMLGVTWSLAVEEQFYLITPLILRALPPRTWLGALGALVIAAAGLRLFLGQGMAAYTLLPCRMDGLFLGVMLALVLAREDCATWIRRHRRGLAVVGVVAFLPLSLFLLKTGMGMDAFKELPGGTLLHLWVALGTALFIALLRTASPEGVLNRTFSLAPLQWMGIRAYGIYLLHPVALHLSFCFFGIPKPVVTGSEQYTPLLLAVALTFVLAAASWRWIESPCLHLARRFRY